MKSTLFILMLLYCGSAYGQINYQSEDNMLSNYQKNASDGYSWRMRDNAYKNVKHLLGKELLLSTIWVTNPMESRSAILVFYKDDIFKLGSRQSGDEISGRYMIKDGNLILGSYSGNIKELKKFGITKDQEICSFGKSNNLLFQDCLSVGERSYFPLGSERNNGEEVEYLGRHLIIDSEIKVMIDNAKFREAPNTEAKTIQVYQYSEIIKKEIYSLKVGTEVYLIARTKETQTIDGSTAPWYFIKVFDGYEGYQYGWVFGAYFGVYDKMKRDEYWNTVLNELKK